MSTAGETRTITPLELADGRVQIMFEEKKLLVEGEEADVQAKQIDILAALAARADEVVQTTAIYEAAWHASMPPGSYVVKTHINKLRSKLGDELSGEHTGLIRSHVGKGYKVKSTLLTSKDGAVDHAQFIADDRIEVNSASELVVADGEILKTITPRLFRLLAHITEEPERVYSHSEIAEREWGEYNPVVAHSVRMGMTHVRYALGKELGRAKTGAIRSVPGLGYYAVRCL